MRILMQPSSTKNCIVCNNSNFVKLFSVEDFDNLGTSFDLFKCCTCKLAQIIPLPNGKMLDEFYHSTYYGSEQQKFVTIIEKLVKLSNKSRALNINKYFVKLNSACQGNKKKILDVGCGRALLLKSFNNIGYDCYGVERSKFSADCDSIKGVTIFKKDLKDIDFNTGSMDVVVLWHVLEHLLKPVETLKELTRILVPGGLLVLSVPNFNSFQALYFKKHWFHLDVPRHTYHFSLTSLSILLANNKYTIIRKSTFSIEQNIFGFIQSFFNKFIFFIPKNSFYFLLKKRGNSFSWYIKLCFWMTLSLFVFPFALGEYLISGIMRKGAVLTIYAKK